MDKRDIFEAFGNIDDRYVESAAMSLDGKKKYASRKLKLLPIAACLAILALAMTSMLMFMMNKPTPPVDTTQGTENPDIPITNRVQISGFALPVQFGNVDGTLAPSSLEQGSRSADGLAVSVKPLQLLEDTYYFYDDYRKSEFRLLLVETQRLLRGSKVVDHFYVKVSPQYAVDFTEYDTLVFIDLWQHGYEGNLVCNVTDNCLEMLDYCVLAHSFTFNCENTIAFSDDVFDESLWTANDAWVWDTEYVRNNLDELVDKNRIPIGPERTLEQTEAKLMEYAHSYESRNALSLYDLESEESKQAWEYVKNIENGLFVMSSDDRAFHAEIRASYTRYINGFETNEGLTIYSDEVSRSNAAFTAEDIENMPDLRSAIYAVNDKVEDGSIMPPHISGETVKTAERVNKGIFGWYVKCTDGKVYGVIRVSYMVITKNYPYLYDDAYYMVEQGSDVCERIDRDALMELLGMKKSQINTVYEIYRSNIYVGEYNENGMDLAGLAVA